MKPYFILALVLLNLFPNNVKAIVFIDSLKISPANPVRNDIVSVLLYTSTTSVSTRIHINKQLINNTFSIEICYTMQGSPAMTFYADTLDMGPLTEGVYKILVSCHRSLDDTQCTYLDTATDSLLFEVMPPVSVNYIDEVLVNIHPNPASNLLHVNVSTSVHIKEAIIYNAYGTLLGSYKGSKRIDISTYPPGIYFIQLNTDKGPYTHRFIKQ